MPWLAISFCRNVAALSWCSHFTLPAGRTVSQSCAGQLGLPGCLHFLRLSPSYPTSKATNNSSWSHSVESRRYQWGREELLCPMEARLFHEPQHCSVLYTFQCSYWHLKIYPWEYCYVVGGKWDAVSKLIIESNKSLKQMHKTLPNHGIYGPKLLQRYL